ncbi:hypothetical protein H4R34_005301, partial [Dimargaris verticillata]
TNRLICHRANAHSSPILAINTHPYLPQCLTASAEEIIIWDTAHWNALHVLPAAPFRILQAEYSWCSQHIVACFDTDTIVVWDAQTFAKVWKVKPPALLTGGTQPQTLRSTLYNAKVSATSPRLTVFALSRDGTWLIAGGR